jgi:hypothetical protein
MSDDTEGSAAMLGSLAWIPLTERLPDEDVEVFVGCFTKRGEVIFHAAAKLRMLPSGKWAWEDDDCVIHHPTHWIPIPAPPKASR